MDGVDTPAAQALLRLREGLNSGRFDVVEELTQSERFRESVRRLISTFPDVQLDTAWIVSEGTRAATWTTIRGTHGGELFGIPPTGKTVEFQAVLAVEVDSTGLVVDFWVVNDWLSVATQLGAQIVPPPT